MRKIILFSLLIFISLSINAQAFKLENFPLLIGKSESEVSEILTSIYSNLPPNSNYLIEKKFDRNADLVLQANYSISDESVVGCIGVFVTIKKIYDKKICTRMLIYGTQKNGGKNISYLKDNFIRVSPGIFEKEFDLLPNAKIISELDVKLDNYHIDYYLANKK